MEIKHTIEILTKDIQDIENLVRNLNNYPTPPSIEIDLAMSKLRNVYELLMMISTDIKSDPNTAHSIQHHMETSLSAPESRLQEPEPYPVEKNSEAVAPEPVTDSRSETDIQKAPPEEPFPVAEEIPQPEEMNSPPQEKEFETKEEAPEEKRSAGEEDKKLKEEVRKAAIIAEKFAASKSINEKIATGSSSDVSSKYTGEPIDSIKRNIGINDRFLIIRELLNGDNERYNQLIQQLDSCENFNQAADLIKTNFSDKTDHEGVEILVKLSRRRYLTSNV